MAEVFAFSTYAASKEVITLADGRLAERTYNSRKGKWGWLVYASTGAAEAFYTDAQWARRSAR
jgi:hypothetical protein